MRRKDLFLRILMPERYKTQRGSDPFFSKGVRPHLVFVLLSINIILLNSPAFAIENSYAGNYLKPEMQTGYYSENYESAVMQKFQRGAENFLLGWLEVPQGIKSEIAYREAGYLPVGIETVVIGGFKGFLNAAKRTGIGIYEGFTCLYPQEPIVPNLHERLY